ncbi:cell surface protein [Enterococcus mundtii 1A]|uniref:WxL domain-containing protein n=1 Tax=Enterococcus mundtii TaxID=53346 RepID=UPI002303A73C|nr:WxL domain-containing protein [Enterococcus mundtii]MDA9428692.1 cell surface protein [Enterococcus mundtii 1A]
MKIKKALIVVSTSLLFFPSLFSLVIKTSMPVSAIQNSVELPKEPKLLDPLNSTTKTKASIFSFEEIQEPHMVGKYFPLVVHTSQEVSEFVLKLPMGVSIVEDQQSTDIKFKNIEGNQWQVQTDSPRVTFSIPLMVEEAGEYEVTIGESKTTLNIQAEQRPQTSEQEASFFEEKENTEESIVEGKTSISNGEQLASSQGGNTTRSAANVSSLQELIRALNDSSVSVINLTRSLGGNAAYAINRPLTINGNGHTLNIQASYFEVNTNYLVMENIVLRQAVNGRFFFRSNSPNTKYVFRGITTDTGSLVVNQRGSTDSVTFEGTNTLRNTWSSLIAIDTVNLINGGIVNHSGPSFISSGKELTIERGASLNSIAQDSINVDKIMNYGDLTIESTQRTIGNHTNSTPIIVELFPHSRTNLQSRDSSVFGSNVKQIQISKFAAFDFINRSGQSVINTDIQIELSSEYLALWELGLQYEERASKVFSEINLTISGINGSMINFTNNDRFQRLYDPSGLAAYSRMSNEEVEEVKRTVRANYLNTEGKEIADSEVVEGLLGDNYQTKRKTIPGYSLTKIPPNETGIFTREEIEVIYIYELSDLIPPIDPLDPEMEVNPDNKPEIPEGQGRLSIDFVSQFNFGKHNISVQDQTYYAQPQLLLNEDGAVNENEVRPNYVQISDRRPESQRNGWELAVTQQEQFKGKGNQVLNGASITLLNQQVVTAQGGTAPELQSVHPLIPGNRQTLLKAQGSEGMGTWIYRFGNADTAEESVMLNVPKGSNPEATSYSTKLTWELSSVPDN